MFISVDRFEGDFAVCEDDNLNIFNISKDKLPKNAKEGDVLKLNGETYIIDYEETERRKKKAVELQKRLF